MKRMLVVMLALSSLAGMAGAEERALYQVFLKNPGDRALIQASGLVPYAVMEHSIIAEGAKAAATASVLSSRALLPAPAQGTFYLILPPFRKTPHEVRALVAQRCEILAEDADAFFVRAAPEAAEELPSRQFHIVRVWMTPIDLGLVRPSQPPRVMAYNPVIQWIIDQITPTEITGMLRDLSGKRPTIVRGVQDTIKTRYTTSRKNSSAIFYFYEQASSYAGIDSVRFHSFTWTSYTDSNVVATKLGRTYPREQYLIDGHIDCTSQSQYHDTLAPGADDNGSGTIAALIAAKVTRQIPFKRTLKYLAFNTEEQGLYGSSRYASEARARGDSILGVLNGDMIGTNYSGNNVVVAYNGNRPGSMVLTNRLYGADTTYHLGLTVQRSTSSPTGSDHYSFWQNGYESGYLEENDFSLVYHTIGDTIGRMDTLYWTKVVKCMVAALCDLAEPDTTFTGVESQGPTSYPRWALALRVFPNPFTSFATLPGHESERFALYDVTGRKVGTYKGNKVGANLSAGVYFLRPENGNARPVRIVKLR
jgi:hypothetical protein